MKPAGAYRAKNVSHYLSKFRWLPFLIQAPQALYTITKHHLNGKGYGLVLGGIQGALSDTFWSVVKAPWHGAPKVVGPPPSDPLGKALRYLTQPPWHARHGSLFSYDDHWILAAADAVAAGIVMQNFSVQQLEPRIEEFLATPVIQFVPYRQDTREVILEAGLDPDADQVPAIPAGELGQTYEQVLSEIARGFDPWIEHVAQEWNDYRSATDLINLMFQTGDEITTWFNAGAPYWERVFTPEEFTFARMFEYQIFPPGKVHAEMIPELLERALELAAGAGKELPGPRELTEAMQEHFPRG